MASPPSYKQSASMSRSRTSPGDIQSVAEAMLRSSLSDNPSSASSTASTLKSYPEKRSGDSSRARDVNPTSAAKLLLSLGSSSKSTSSTSSRTRERLRLAELERDKLRGVVKEEQEKASKERAIAERLKREAGASGLSTVEAEIRVTQLKRDALAAGAESRPYSTAGMFKAACSTDLLFLIDTTGSMMGHINAAKNQVESIVNEIKVTFLNEAAIRIAIVGYKDHSDLPNIQFLDFTPSTDQVHSFLAQLIASGGADAPEDVLGGIRQALNATWMQQTRCIIHIADAPPHGRTLHDFPDSSDNFPNPGSEPHRLTYEPLVKQMVGLKINYVLLRINDNSTDRMAFNFLKVYTAASADCKLHKSNKYYSQACGLSANPHISFGSWSNSTPEAKGGLLFVEEELGTTFSKLRHLIVASVTLSASHTAVRMSTSMARTGKSGLSKKLGKTLAAVEEDEDDIKLEAIPPQWNTPGWLDEKLSVEGFSPDVIVHGAGTLNDMMADDDNIKMSITELTIRKRSRPFAQGAMRVASYARTAASNNRFVVKSFKKGRKRLAHLAEDMRCQALCKAFALEFNALSGEKHAIDFIVTTCLKDKSKTGSDDECLSLEPFIDGTYVKYNNNCGWVKKDELNNQINHAAQAFSHFTFERSKGFFLVCDLQGVGNVLTDPAIHTRDPNRFMLADPNLGKEGFKFFFASHVCNHICHNLGLKSNASMIISGKYEFREKWPSMDNVVCCSNKLCGKILRLARANKSNKFPGHHWCDICWLQLLSSVVKRICVAPGPHHEFEVSKFFCESQGRTLQQKCPKHYETVPGAAVVSDSFWAKLKRKNRTSKEIG